MAVQRGAELQDRRLTPELRFQQHGLPRRRFAKRAVEIGGGQSALLQDRGDERVRRRDVVQRLGFRFAAACAGKAYDIAGAGHDFQAHPRSSATRRNRTRRGLGAQSFPAY